MENNLREVLNQLATAYRKYPNYEQAQISKEVDKAIALLPAPQEMLSENEIYKIMENHYWNSLNKDREVILKHCRFVAQLLANKIPAPVVEKAEY